MNDGALRCPRCSALALALCLTAWGTAYAQPAVPVQDFPADATAPTIQALESALSEQVFRARFADGQQLRYQFKGVFLYVDTSRGGRDTGRWHAREGQLCVDFRQFPSGCADVRQNGDGLWLRRTSTGEVTRLMRD